jgi:hypothetical protein
MMLGDTGHEPKKNTGNSMTLPSNSGRRPAALAEDLLSSIARRQGSATERQNVKGNKTARQQSRRKMTTAKERQGKRRRPAAGLGSGTFGASGQYLAGAAIERYGNTRTRQVTGFPGW